MAPLESLIAVASVIFVGFGVVGGVLNKYGKTNKFIKMARILGLLGFPLFVLAVAIAVYRGRFIGFFTAIFSSFTGFFTGVFTGKDYSGACFDDGRCAVHCCQHMMDESVKWKDCSEWCDSKPNTIGTKTEGDCQYDQGRDAYCNVQNVSGGGSNSYAQGCNYDEHLGPITCECCYGANDSKWWDCSSNCEGKPGAFGTNVPVTLCEGVTNYNCNTNS